MQKRPYKIEEGKVIAGVCGGVAEYLDVDGRPRDLGVDWAFGRRYFGVYHLCGGHAGKIKRMKRIISGNQNSLCAAAQRLF